MFTFGCNDEGALGRDTSEEGSEFSVGKVDLSEKIVQVSCGDSHTAALTEDGRAYIWGTFRVRCTFKLAFKDNLKALFVVTQNNLFA